VPTKNRNEADSNFAHFFRESLSVVTNVVITAGREGDERVLLYEPPVRLQRKEGDPLFLSVTQTYRISPDGRGFKATTTSYSYELSAKKESRMEIIAAFHWHPGKTAKLKWPHVHIRGNTAEGDLGRKHFPTARISIEDFLRFLIRDFGVKPRLEYDVWKEILTRNKREFIAHASWLDWKPLIS
jgi:hypothetical protein